MHKDVVILVAEDDKGHAGLIRKNLARAGVVNEVLHFRDGQEILDFLFRQGEGPHRLSGTAYVLLLDIRMPKVDGVQVLERVKGDRELRKLPVIMITTTEDPREVERCHALGCSNYITKPIDFDQFIDVVKSIEDFWLTIVKLPSDLE